MADDRCWICLGSDGDLPPLGNPSESKELVSPCGCSLRVHQKCLLDWTANVALQSSQEGVFKLKRCNNPEFIVRDENGSHVVSLKPTVGLKIFTNEELRCPQCQTLYKLTCKPSAVLRFTNLVKLCAKRATNYFFWSTISSVIIGSTVVAVFSLSASLGLKSLEKLAPTSVLMKLLNVNERSLETALRNNKIGSKQLFLMAGFPMFLLSLRSDNKISSFYRNLYPVTFLTNIWKYPPKDPKNFLLMIEPMYQLYQFLFRLTINRYHYRLLRGINTCFLGNKFPLEEIEEIDQENQEFTELEIQRINLDEKLSLNWFEKLKLWVSPHYSAKAKEILKKRRKREFDLSFKNDYSSSLFEKSKMLTMLTTWLWPFAGQIIGKYLIKSSWIRALTNKVTNTPDESTYLTNLIGCCVVVLIKDLFNLYNAWRYCKQYKNISILDSRFKGFELVKVSPPKDEMEQSQHENDEAGQIIHENGIPGAWVQAAVAADEENGDLRPNNDLFNFDRLDDDHDHGAVNRVVVNVNYGDMLNRMLQAFDRRDE